VVDLALLIDDDVQQVVWDQVADEVVGLFDLDAQDSLVIESFPLDHLPMVDADA
jgi:hypothetical protein